MGRTTSVPSFDSGLSHSVQGLVSPRTSSRVPRPEEWVTRSAVIRGLVFGGFQYTCICCTIRPYVKPFHVFHSFSHPDSTKVTRFPTLSFSRQTKTGNLRLLDSVVLPVSGRPLLGTNRCPLTLRSSHSRDDFFSREKSIFLLLQSFTL